MAPVDGLARVVTWNIWWRYGAWQDRERALAAELAALRPDVVCLQEVWSTADDSAATRLAAALGPEWSRVESVRPTGGPTRAGDEGVGIGTAVLSRWPVLERAEVRLPAAGPGDSGRTALFALLDAPGAQVPVTTTHLPARADRSALRCAQVRELARFVTDRAGRPGDGFPTVVTGDLNAQPDSDEVRLLCGHRTAPAAPGCVLVDAWDYAPPSDPGWTWDRANPHVLATWSPSARIDYVLVGAPRRRDGAGHVVEVGRGGCRPVDGTWPSDHAAVVVDLALPAV